MSRQRVGVAALAAWAVVLWLAPAAADEPPAPAAEAEPAEHASGQAGGAADLEVYDPLFDDEEAEASQLGTDPYEGFNRMTFAFNTELDRWVLDPVTHAYQFVVPGAVRRGVNRFFLHLNSPVVFANEVLQLRPTAAATTFGRFMANSTLGLGGLLDVAADQMDIPRGEADFGQTLARYGVPRGPYLVFPLFGPSTARDATGTIVDQGLDPLTYFVGPLNLQWQLILGSGEGLVLRDANLDSIDALRDASIDYYAALRSAYLQSRRALELEAAWDAAPAEVPRATDSPRIQPRDAKPLFGGAPVPTLARAGR
jgi:phospholipid-binding lipoprotein MlaA